MAINREPQNSSGSDAQKNESEAQSKDNAPQKLDSTLNHDHDLEENLLMPVTPQVSSSTNSITSRSKPLETKPWHKKRRWWQTWQIWGMVLVLCSGAIGYSATSMLLKLPKTQSCSKVFWPVASASVRLYCAQTAAEDKTLDGLLKAIALVVVLPEDHPLRPEIDRNITKWTSAILALGEEEFQTGQLQKAIATARQIPKSVAANKLVATKIEGWQSIWAEAEKNYQEVENRLREANWNEAFTWATRLTESPNKYWATTKYEESINNINVAQEENASLDKAQIQVSNGSIEDLLLAIDKAEDIPEKSYAYDQAQKVMAQAKDKLLAYIEQLIQQQDWRELLQITNRIPNSLKLQNKVKDWNILGSAGTSASLDTVFGIEEAIAEAKKLKPDSPYYETGQKLISGWKLETEDVKHLSQAKELALVGTISNLSQAISEASLIPSGNPRYAEAREEINKWQGQIQVIEDQPILNRAREISYGNNVDAWRRAIAEINLISSSSPLYREAQSYSQTWRANIERSEDQPFLDRADSFANLNNYAAAIDAARKIRSGRTLYGEAQNKISLWQQEIDGERYLAEANSLSSQGTPEALARAIKVARQVSSNSSLRTQVVQDVNEWGSQILTMAREASNNSLERAIAIARQVPSGTTSYSQAQTEIQRWQEILDPPEIERELAPLPPSFKLEKLEKQRDEDN
jgi:hypothetical protein